MPRVRAHVVVKGRVQGVYFRAETQYEARQLGVNGWVKNLRDRSVEAVFEGEEDSVKSMVKWCNHGPARAIVTDVSIDWQEYKGEFDRFSITY
ncbi:MAG: acylphosphatase [Deltaproteobacteria bacterium]|jgi:acylphosphatase|nr:MAG: acylphosphatase [Deltaproteobacteria bacterium]